MFASDNTTPVKAPPAAPPVYSPIFRGDVIVSGYGFTSPVNPRLCLSEDSVPGLIAELQAAGLTAVEFQRDPMGRWPWLVGVNEWEQSVMVPWLKFSDGTEMNAGLLADAWKHGYPPSYARNLAVRYYQQNAFDQGFGPEPPSSPVTA